MPVTQGLGHASKVMSSSHYPHLSDSPQCPDVSAIPPVSSCSSTVSNCWSVGEPDWDCPDNGLCCFDGCANTCLPAPAAPAQTAQSPPPPVPEKQTQSQPGNSPNIGNGLLFPPPDSDSPISVLAPPPQSPPAQTPGRAPQTPSSKPGTSSQGAPKRPRPSNVAKSQPQPPSQVFYIF